MSHRFLITAILISATLAGVVGALREGHGEVWRVWWGKMMNRIDVGYSPQRFKVDLVDHLNYPRMATRLSPLAIDGELETWVQEKISDGLDVTDLNAVADMVKVALPRYAKVLVVSATSPSLEGLLKSFQSTAQDVDPEITHVACALRDSAGGLSHQALLIMGQRLQDFSPELLRDGQTNQFFSVCIHCGRSHICRIPTNQRSMGLECPNPECGKTYAVIAADRKGVFHYANEFLTGYQPPALFARDQSRAQELFTIWAAVHENCRYVKDAGSRKNQTDSWQFAIETQSLLVGDCEDSSIFLADWLIARGFQARVALGKYGDMGGHAWVVAKLDDKEYLLESTEALPDPDHPPLASQVGSRYVPEVTFDRFHLYVRKNEQTIWNGDYWSTKLWTAIEPRAVQHKADAAKTPQKTVGDTNMPRSTVRDLVPPDRLARMRFHGSAVTFGELSGFPSDTPVWSVPVPAHLFGAAERTPPSPPASLGHGATVPEQRFIQPTDAAGIPVPTS